MAKVVIDKHRFEERLAEADDAGSSEAAVAYRGAVALALEWGARQAVVIEARRDNPGAKVPTVRTAVETYIDARIRRSAPAGANAAVRLRLHVLSDEALASTPLRKLRERTIKTWRERLPSAMAPSTVNRLLNDLRAALNAAAELHRRELPPQLPAEIRAGTKAIAAATSARKQILTEAQVRAAMEAAWSVDADFGPVVMLAAATGARFSQLAAVKVGDLQQTRRRIMIPSSKKGRAAKARPPIAAPLSNSVLARLAGLGSDRPTDDLLLQKWGYRRAGKLKWERDHRRGWNAAYEVEKLWAATVSKAGLPAGTVMYALRHSSIVRGLVAGLPVRMVAAAHDTSVEMIEAHYAAFILDATEDLHRRHALEAA